MFGDEEFNIKCIYLAYDKKAVQSCCGEGELGDLFVDLYNNVSNFCLWTFRRNSCDEIDTYLKK